MGFTNFPNGITSFGIPVFGDMRVDPSAQKVIFVDANVRTSGGDGTSWDDAYQDITTALADSQTNITTSNLRGWAKRNTIFYCGDYISETLTTAAQQTDVIGVGSDLGSTPRVVTNWTIATARASFRLINILIQPVTTAPGLTFPAGMHGWELHYVTIQKATGITNTAQLLSTDCRDFQMNHVRILPDNAAAMSTIGFNIAGTTYGVGRAAMYNCEIHGTEAFNVVDTSAYYEGAIAKNCLFKATNLCIDDNSDSIAFVDCRLITAAASGSAAGSGIVDWNQALICGNIATSSDGFGPLPDLNAHG